MQRVVFYPLDILKFISFIVLISFAFTHSAFAMDNGSLDVQLPTLCEIAMDNNTLLPNNDKLSEFAEKVSLEVASEVSRDLPEEFSGNHFSAVNAIKHKYRYIIAVNEKSKYIVGFELYDWLRWQNDPNATEELSAEEALYFQQVTQKLYLPG